MIYNNYKIHLALSRESSSTSPLLFYAPGCSQRLVQWVERWQRSRVRHKRWHAPNGEWQRSCRGSSSDMEGRGSVKGGRVRAATVPVFQISHTEISVQPMPLPMRFDRWQVESGSVRFALTDLQAPSLSPSLSSPALSLHCTALSVAVFSAFGSHALRFSTQRRRRRNFHLSRNLADFRSGREIRLLFCHLPIWERKRGGRRWCCGWWWWALDGTVYGLQSSGTLPDPTNISNGSDWSCVLRSRIQCWSQKIGPNYTDTQPQTQRGTDTKIQTHTDTHTHTHTYTQLTYSHSSCVFAPKQFL